MKTLSVFAVALHPEGVDRNIGASAVQGRKVYGLTVSKPQTLYIKRTETAVG